MMSESSAALLAAPARPRVTARAWAISTLVVCSFGFWLRWINAHSDLGSPWVDENDVIQQAVAFMGGQWRYYLPEYGPLPMYLLAALYHLVALLRGLSPLDYAARVFYDGQEQYLLGRLSCAACYLPLAIWSYRFLTTRYGRSAASISAILLSLPLLDQLTKSTVRIDVPQGAFQLAALLLLALAVEQGRYRHWLGAGLCAGLSMACKPLPGLLVAPCFLAASWFAAGLESAGAPAGTATRGSASRALLLRCWRTLRRPALWAAGVLALAAALLANPTALDLKEFIRAQSNATSYYSGPGAPGAHLSAFEALRGLRLPWIICAGLSALAMVFVRDLRAKLLALFPLIYATAFWGRPVRTYYMVAPAMALCVVIGICVGSLIERRREPEAEASGSAGPAAEGEPAALGALWSWPGWLAPGLAALLVTAISWVPVSDLHAEKQLPTKSTLAREWIHANIPSGTKLFHYGSYAASPRLVAATSRQAAEWADFFDYGREKYEFYWRAFRKAHSEYLAQGRPYYDVASHRASPEPANRVKPWLSRTLVKRAVREGRDYIILAGYRGDDYRKLGYSWLDDVELVQHIGKIAIFRVPRPAAAPPQPPATPPQPDAAQQPPSAP